jgi:hypothetical protein
VPNLMNSVVNQHSGKKYNVSTARKFPLKVWETAVIRSGFLSAFSTKNILFVEESIGEYPDQIMDAHKRACVMAITQPIEEWQMTFEQIRERQSEAARIA